MVDMKAPDPQNTTGVNTDTTGTSDHRNPSVLKVTLAGCGGGGINLARPLAKGASTAQVLFFDTSMTNSRPGEDVYVLTATGDGSGSRRAENSRTIESVIAGMTDEDFGANDVAIVTFTLAGGSGSVIGPLLAREYLRRKGMRVICVAVADTGSSIAADNTLKTLKTLASIANNANVYLPVVILSNDQERGRRGADEASRVILTDLIELLTKPVFEVDRNDRLNWIDPSKVISAKPGLKLLQVASDASIVDPSIIIGQDSSEMVDSLLIIQNQDDDTKISALPSRLKKVGFHNANDRTISGTVSGDITAIDKIIDQIERVAQHDRSQRHENVDRLKTESNDDLIL